MSLYQATLPQMRKMLQNMKGWLEEAEQYAQARDFHVDNFLNARLHLDQFELVRQVQAACDNVKGAAARATGQQAPKHEDNEKTFEQLKERIDKVLAYTADFTEADFAGLEERVVPLPFMPDKGAPAIQYLSEFALPNFYFHAAMVYAILRHNGVKLGKLKFIGGMEIVDLPS